MLQRVGHALGFTLEQFIFCVLADLIPSPVRLNETFQVVIRYQFVRAAGQRLIESNARAGPARRGFAVGGFL
ncbi:hypothetical protein ADL33_24355 [Streptomyces sp. NRRL WC-3604]|nr:hypothetical protein ADL33_24355 [Streptomyces sp. NRRL WC-3604]